jgi:hypothetical protein
MAETVFQVSQAPQELKGSGVDPETTEPPVQLVQTVQTVNKVPQALTVLQVFKVLWVNLQTENSL